VSIALQSTVHPRHLLVECSGTYSIESFRRVYDQAFTLAAEAGRDAVLIDARNVTGREPTLTERYDLAVHVADLQSAQTPRIRMALLGHEPMIHRERFGEVVATTRGAVARVFTDESQALGWLLGRRKSS
jgi:hypothetical protein